MQDGPAIISTSKTSARRRSEAASGSRERSLDRMAQMLDFLHAHRRPIATADLARALNAPRSTVYNLVKSLTELGILESAGEDGRIYFGHKVYLWGLDYMRENPLVRRGREEVDRLSHDTGETAELCMLQSGRYTIVHMCPGRRPFRISSAVGLQIPLPWTASGRLLLSDMRESEVDALIADEEFVLPDGRIISRSEFHAATREARQAGYSITAGLVDRFTKCLAAPVFSSDGKVAATLCFVVSMDTREARVAELVDLLVERAASLSFAPDPLRAD